MIVAKIQKLHDKDPTVYDFGEHGRLQPVASLGRPTPMACAAALEEGADGPKTNDEYKALLYNLPAIAGLLGHSPHSQLV